MAIGDPPNPFVSGYRTGRLPGSGDSTPPAWDSFASGVVGGNLPASAISWSGDIASGPVHHGGIRSGGLEFPGYDRVNSAAARLTTDERLVFFLLDKLMADTERGLLTRLLENPNDAAQRAVYCDYLKEQGRYASAKMVEGGWTPGGDR